MPAITPKYLQAERHIEEVHKRVPRYIQQYIFEKREKYSVLTLDGYLYSIVDFFEWMIAEKILPHKTILEITCDDLANLKKEDVLLYVSKLKESHIATQKGVIKTRSKASVARTLQALRSLFKYLTVQAEDPKTGEPYFYRNVMQKIEIPIEKETKARRSKRIEAKIYQPGQIEEFLYFAEFEYEKLLSKHQLVYHQNDKLRDLAILWLLFGSGIRGSECISLQIDNIYERDGYIEVIRKGDKLDAVSVKKTVFTHLNRYLKERGALYGVKDDYPFVFVSLSPNGKGVHMSNQTLLRMVKRYTKAYGKEITPHKARYSFAKHYTAEGGTMIGLRDQLGHNNIETTALYMTEGMEEQQRVLQKMDSNHESSDDSSIDHLKE